PGSACAVNFSPARSQSFTAPGASSDWNCISNVHRQLKLVSTYLCRQSRHLCSPGPPFVCARFQNGIDFFNYGKKFVGISFLNGARGDFFPIRFLFLHWTHCRSSSPLDTL